MSTDEIPFYSLRDQIGSTLDMAIHQVAPKDRVLWDIGWHVLNTPQGPMLVGQVVLTMPSALIGQGRLVIASGVEDLAQLEQPPAALELIRHMVEILRDMKAKQLAMGNGKPGG